MKAYVQLMGGKHRIVLIAPRGQRVTLLTAYQSKQAAEQACKTYGFELDDAQAPHADVPTARGVIRHVK